jgi:hypothetical protein
MKRNTTILTYFFIILLSPALLFAGFPKVGTTAAPFLKIGVGARAVSLGGNFTAISNDVSAMYWNPAGLTEIGSNSVQATHTSWFAGISHDAVQMAIPISDFSAIGLDLIYLTSGDIEQTTIEDQKGNGIFYNTTDLALGIAFAQKITDLFALAVKAKLIRQTIFNEEASSFAFDFGTIYKTEFNGLRIGMNLANFGGSMMMTGNDLIVINENPVTGQQVESHLKTESWPLPIIFRIGLAIDIFGAEESLIQNRLNRITLSIEGTHPNDNYETIGTGVEYEWNELLALRMGYKMNHEVENLSFGGGLKFILGGIRFNVDYAYADFGDLDVVQRFTAGFSF